MPEIIQSKTNESIANTTAGAALSAPVDGLGSGLAALKTANTISIGEVKGQSSNKSTASGTSEANAPVSDLSSESTALPTSSSLSQEQSSDEESVLNELTFSVRATQNDSIASSQRIDDVHNSEISEVSSRWGDETRDPPTQLWPNAMPSQSSEGDIAKEMEDIFMWSRGPVWKRTFEPHSQTDLRVLEGSVQAPLCPLTSGSNLRGVAVSARSRGVQPYLRHAASDSGFFGNFCSVEDNKLKFFYPREIVPFPPGKKIAIFRRGEPFGSSPRTQVFATSDRRLVLVDANVESNVWAVGPRGDDPPFLMFPYQEAGKVNMEIFMPIPKPYDEISLLRAEIAAFPTWPWKLDVAFPPEVVIPAEVRKAIEGRSSWALPGPAVILTKSQHLERIRCVLADNGIAVDTLEDLEKVLNSLPQDLLSENPSDLGGPAYLAEASSTEETLHYELGAVYADVNVPVSKPLPPVRPGRSYSFLVQEEETRKVLELMAGDLATGAIQFRQVLAPIKARGYFRSPRGNWKTRLKGIFPEGTLWIEEVSGDIPAGIFCAFSDNKDYEPAIRTLNTAIINGHAFGVLDGSSLYICDAVARADSELVPGTGNQYIGNLGINGHINVPGSLFGALPKNAQNLPDGVVLAEPRRAILNGEPLQVVIAGTTFPLPNTWVTNPDPPMPGESAQAHYARLTNPVRSSSLAPSLGLVVRPSREEREHGTYSTSLPSTTSSIRSRGGRGRGRGRGGRGAGRRNPGDRPTCFGRLPKIGKAFWTEHHSGLIPIQHTTKPNMTVYVEK